MKDLVCSPSNCDVMVAGRGSLFGSTDNGSSWQLVYPTARDIIVLFLRFAWHPKSPTTVWFYGEGNFYQPMLGRSTDAGLTWNEYSRFLNMPLDNAIYSMAFDAAGPDTIYIGAQGAVVKSTNAAQDWISGQRMNALFTDARGGFFYGLVTHPTVSGTFFASADTTMYCSTDGGQTVYLLPSPTRRAIFAMAYDATRDYLYIGSYEGIFRLKNPLSAQLVRHK